MSELDLNDTKVLQDREAELAAVALAQLKPDRFAEMALEADHFQDLRLRDLATKAQELYRENAPGRVLDWARQPAQAERYRETLDDLKRARPGKPADVARRLTEKRTARAVWRAVGGLKAALATGDQEKLADAAHAVSDAAIRPETSKLTTLADVVIRTAMKICDPESREGWIRPPQPSWREAIGWIKPGTIMVMAAGTNVGKSQGAVHLLVGLGAAGEKVGYISVEDEETVAGQRGIARLSGVSTDLQESFHDDLEPQSAAKVMSQLCGALDKKRVDAAYANVLFEEAVGANCGQVESACMRMAARGAKVIAVDYLQEIDTSDMGRGMHRSEAISQLVRRLKKLAVRLRFCLVLVSQINREGGKRVRDGKEPSMLDLKESGDIENKSEIVIMMAHDPKLNCVVLTLAKAKGRPNVGHKWYMARITDQGGMLGDISPPSRNRAGAAASAIRR